MVVSGVFVFHGKLFILFCCVVIACLFCCFGMRWTSDVSPKEVRESDRTVD